MLRTPPILFTTPRLILHAATQEHASSLFSEYTGRLDASRYLQRGAHPSQARTEAVIAAWGESNWRQSDRFAWTILRLEDEKPIGLFLLFLDGDSAEIHYGLGPSFWAQGLLTEAGLAVMDWVMQHSSLTEVSTCCAADHMASLRVLEKIGLSRIRLLRDELLLASTGARVDAWQYSWKRS